MFRSFVFSTLLVLSCTLISSRTTMADPSTRNPEAAMGVHPFTGVSEDNADTENINAESIVANAYRIVVEMEDYMEKMQPVVAKGDLARLDPKLLGRYNNAAVIVAMQAQQLLSIAQPAGLDLQRRNDVVARWMGSSSLSYSATPKGSQFVARLRKSLQRSRPKRLKLLAEVRDSVSAQSSLGELLAAEKRIIGSHKEVFSAMGFLALSFRKPDMFPYGNVMNPLQSALNGKLKQRAVMDLRAAIEKHAPNPQSIATLFETAAGGFGTAEEIQLQNAESMMGVSGFVNAAGTQFRTMHAKCVQAWGMAMALDALGDQQKMQAQLRTRWDATRQALAAGMAKTIAADLGRAAGGNADALRNRYVQWVMAISIFATVYDDPEFAAAMRGALLQALPDGSPLRSDAVAHAMSTSPAEYFRGLVSRDIKLQPQKTPSANQYAHTQFVSSRENPGVYSPKFNGPGTMRLGAHADDVMRRIATTINGQPVVAGGPIRSLDMKGKTAITPLDDRVYLNVLRVPFASLKSSTNRQMLSDADHPPLSIAAGRAMMQASSGQYDRVVGKVRGVVMHSLMVWLMTRPRAADCIIPLTSMPERTPMREPMTHIVLRFDLQPVAASHLLATGTDS